MRKLTATFVAVIALAFGAVACTATSDSPSPTDQLKEDVANGEWTPELEDYVWATIKHASEGTYTDADRECVLDALEDEFPNPQDIEDLTRSDAWEIGFEIAEICSDEGIDY